MKCHIASGILKTASESTYRKLARRYPNMKYLVCRACAVAGYTNLYEQLDILPEVHIAEEARECGNVAIYGNIMSQPVLYEAMNDYTRSVAQCPSPGAYLNGDTAVCKSLNEKQEHSSARKPDLFDDAGEPIYLITGRGYRINIFDITEDMNIQARERKAVWVDEPILPPVPSDVGSLLFTPLPRNFPIVDKDFLILMAAYYGDIDRYTRLRRSIPVEQEVHCCVRGIYHNTMFALWWAHQEQYKLPKAMLRRIPKAITARLIMKNGPITPRR